nr:CAP domain-containing protein [Mycolicibacterium stellerae]
MSGALFGILSAGVLLAAPTAHADNKRLNDGVVANVYTIQHQAGCTNKVRINPKLQLAAEWHTQDVLANRSLDGDIGSDGTSVSERARNAGYVGHVSETVAINPALAINNLDILNQWFYQPDYYAIMSDCRNNEIGVWSLNSLDRSVVVAMYGQGDR